MQDGINASSLSITAITYLSPTSTSFLFSQSAIVHNTNIFTPTLDPFNATLYLVSANGTLFPDALTTITIPAIHALDNSQVNITNTPITIADEAAVSEYCIAVLTQKNVTNRLVGRTNVHLGGLPVNTVDYNQDVTYAGMNSLEGFNVTDVRINITAAEGEPNLSGVAVIPNPSVLTFEMVSLPPTHPPNHSRELTHAQGNVTLAISTSTSTTSLGNTTIPNLTLVPGLNHFPLTGHLNISATSAVTNGTGYVNLLLRGESVVYDGVDLSYYVAALQAQALELVLNVRQVLEDSGH